MSRSKARPPIYGLIAEFEKPEALVNGIRSARQRGFRNMEAYTPFSIEAVDEAMENPRNKIPLISLQ